MMVLQSTLRGILLDPHNKKEGLMIDYENILNNAREIGTREGRRAWDHTCPYVLGGSVSGHRRFHFDNASTIIYAIEEEDPTRGLLPRPSLNQSMDCDLAGSLRGHDKAPVFTMRNLAEELKIRLD